MQFDVINHATYCWITYGFMRLATLQFETKLQKCIRMGTLALESQTSINKLKALSAYQRSSKCMKTGIRSIAIFKIIGYSLFHSMVHEIALCENCNLQFSVNSLHIYRLYRIRIITSINAKLNIGQSIFFFSLIFFGIVIKGGNHTYNIMFVILLSGCSQ